MPNIVNQQNTTTEFPVELRDLVKPLGFAQHSRLKARFVTYCKISRSNDCCYSKSYQNSNGVLVDSFAMTEQQARFFAMYIDPVNGRVYAEHLETKARQADDTKVQLLEAKVAKLENKPVKVLAMSSRVDRRSVHVIRKELHKDGICDHWTESVIHHYFPVNAHGRSLGYTNTGKGKRKTVDLNK